MVNLYGIEHPTTLTSIENLTTALADYINEHEQTTWVFTREMLIVNDHSYAASPDSLEMLARLRARGVMAITFLHGTTLEQALGFAEFLNADPQEVQSVGGPREYLRRHSVVRIVVTESVYTTDGNGCAESDERVDMRSANLEQTLSAAIDWLSRQDEESASPRLPIAQILSQPDAAAKLIHEAVTKLHASQSDSSDSDLAGKVVNDLKNLASGDEAEWDNTVPHIRRAMMKLPAEMRPTACGFSVDKRRQNAPTANERIMDIAQLETMVSQSLQRQSDDTAAYTLPTLSDLQPLFGTKVTGLLSGWRAELQPATILRSCGQTYETLMTWTDSTAEYARIANSMAALIARAVAIKDIESAMRLCEGLTREIKQDAGDWRSINARAALESLDTSIMRSLVTDALSANGYHAREIAASLVETMPKLALEMIELLGVHRGEQFDESLKSGIARYGQPALPKLAEILRLGASASKTSAIELLIVMNTVLSMKTIADLVDGPDTALAVTALRKLKLAESPMAVGVCISALSNRSSDLRCEALACLSAIGSPAALSHITAIASGKGYDTAERLIAIRVLGEIGRREEIALLEALASHRPLLGRKRYEDLNTAARHAVGQIRARLGIPEQSRVA
jgi:hypothetical protein